MVCTFVPGVLHMTVDVLHSNRNLKWTCNKRRWLVSSKGTFARDWTVDSAQANAGRVPGIAEDTRL